MLVQVAPGVDEEGLEVAKECMKEAFKITSDSARDYNSKPVSLVSIFTSPVDESSSSSGPDLSNSVDASKEPLFKGQLWFAFFVHSSSFSC